MTRVHRIAPHCRNSILQALTSAFGACCGDVFLRLQKPKKAETPGTTGILSAVGDGRK